MRQIKRTAMELFDNPVLVGAMAILIAVVGVYVSYSAQNGLPFAPSYEVSVQLPDADELVKDADVRIGGTRVGLVLSITPDPARATRPYPIATVTLRLNRSVAPLPVDSHAGVRLLSALGGKYVELQPGASREGIPDGGTQPISQALPLVDLDQALRTFGPVTISGVRGTLGGLGDALAGRGSAVNASIVNLHAALPGLGRVLHDLVAPGTDLAGFVRGAAATTGALAAVAGTLGNLLADGATTFQALDAAAPALGQSLDELPQTESSATFDLQRSEPALAHAQALFEALRPAGPPLDGAVRQLDAIARGAPPVFAKAPALAAPLNGTLTAVDRLARDPTSTAAFRIVGNSDLASFSASAFFGLGAILRSIAPGQLHCNIAVPWLANVASALSQGDATGPFLRGIVVVHQNELYQSGALASDMHQNFYPNENASECEAGNEPYGSGKALGNPAGAQQGAQLTAQPPGVAARAAGAGLQVSGP
jgi:virulence factor Mce-like protein